MPLVAITQQRPAAYPWGLFGDQLSPPGPLAPAAAVGPAAVPQEPVPATAAPAVPAEGLEPPRAPRGLLVLLSGARGLVVLFLVLGVVQNLAGAAVNVTTANNARKTTQARSDLTAAHNTLAGQVQQHQQQLAGCPAPVQLSCIQSAERELADAFAAYATELRRIQFPASAQAEAAELEDLADQIATALRERAVVASPEEYQRLAADSQQLGNSFDQQEQALVRSLSA